MARGQPSAADRELIEEVGRRGEQVTATQLERWRNKGWLPPNTRRGLGRGKGSSSQADKATADLAAALAAKMSQGVSGRSAVLGIFVESVLPRPDGVIPPCPPEPAVRAVIDSALSRSQVRSPSSPLATRDDVIDAVYEVAEGRTRRLPRWHPGVLAEIRDSVEGRTSKGVRESERVVRSAVQHLLVAQSIGADDVGLDTILDAAVDMGLVGSELKDLVRDAEPSARERDLWAARLLTLEARRQAVRDASLDEIRAALVVSQAGQGVNFMLFLLGVALPDDERVVAAFEKVKRSHNPLLGCFPWSADPHAAIHMAASLLLSPLGQAAEWQLFTDIMSGLSGQWDDLLTQVTTSLHRMAQR